MISPYLRPQATITQILQQTAERDISRRNPIVIGPQFQLYLNDGRDMEDAKQSFLAAGGTHNYLDNSGNAISLTSEAPDTATAELYGEDLEALVAEFAASTWEVDADRPDWRAIRVAADSVSGSGTLNALLDGRAVSVGDVISSDWNDGNGGTGTSRRRVVSLLGKVTPASTPPEASALGPFNPATTGADTGAAVAADTDGVWTVSDAALTPDLAVFQGHGYTPVKESDSVRYLGEIVTATVTLAGAAGTAEFTLTSVATGQTATAVVSADAGSGEYELDLTGVGYPGSTMELTHSGTAALNETAKVQLFPAYTAHTVSDITVAGDYTGSVDRRYAIEILAATTAGAEADIKVYDLSGQDASVTYTDAVAGGAVDAGTGGFTVDLGAGVYAKGEIFFVDVAAATTSTTEFDGVILDGPAVPAATMEEFPATSLEAVDVFQRFTGVLDSDNLTGGIGDALTAGSGDWAYAASLGLNESDTTRTTVSLSPFADGYGTVFLSYRAILKPGTTEGMIELDSELEILDKLGETGYENWLGRGALNAFQGNQNQVVYALRTGGDTVEDFAAALRKIQTTDDVYALAIMTDSQDVMELVRDHCETMSNKYNKNFRRCYVGTDSPGAYVSWGALPDDTYRRGDFASSVVTLAEEFRSDWKFAAADVGASIRIQSLGLEFEITEVLSEFEVLTDADASLNAANTGLEITRPDTPENNALFVNQRSSALASRRTTNVWCDDPTTTVNGATVVVPMKFVAAEIAGLRCALLPQQGLTLTEVLSVDAAPSMYTTFEPETLDNVAANGTLIVAQETEGGDLFIRHQLTTATTEGALAYEDNVGVIVDDFAFEVKYAFREYIGRRNATPDTIAEIDDKLKALAAAATTVDLVDADVGAPVIAFFDEKGEEGEVTVRQDGDLADTLLTYVLLRVPLPLNGINHYIDVEVSELLGSEDN